MKEWQNLFHCICTMTTERATSAFMYDFLMFVAHQKEQVAKQTIRQMAIQRGEGKEYYSSWRVLEEKRLCYQVTGGFISRLTWFWCPNRERKQSQNSTQLEKKNRSFCLLGHSSGPGSKPILDAVPLPERTGCWDRAVLSALSQTAFPQRANMLLFSCYRATDIGHRTFFSPLSNLPSPTFPVPASLPLSPSYHKVKSLFLQRNSIVYGDCRGSDL